MSEELSLQIQDLAYTVYHQVCEVRVWQNRGDWRATLTTEARGSTLFETEGHPGPEHAAKDLLKELKVLEEKWGGLLY